MPAKKNPKSGQPDRKGGAVVGLARPAYDLVREIARREDRTMTDVLGDALDDYAAKIGFVPRKSRGWKRD